MTAAEAAAVAAAAAAMVAAAVAAASTRRRKRSRGSSCRRGTGSRTVGLGCGHFHDVAPIIPRRFLIGRTRCYALCDSSKVCRNFLEKKGS